MAARENDTGCKVGKRIKQRKGQPAWLLFSLFVGRIVAEFRHAASLCH
jgi:hypothetical protein